MMPPCGWPPPPVAPFPTRRAKALTNILYVEACSGVKAMRRCGLDYGCAVRVTAQSAMHAPTKTKRLLVSVMFSVASSALTGVGLLSLNPWSRLLPVPVSALSLAALASRCALTKHFRLSVSSAFVVGLPL